ncbi:retrovirus-related pol polyprotein from transposon TNT 1-94 [Tanacetum coccineum]|uniref:Retrovirus-related pol polyprotein from transposon TNT 1-94 n=1 Tax=Tanacetum coccineum TaxID=301880 RepID=A0ABQ5J1T3_9ASTR
MGRYMLLRSDANYARGHITPKSVHLKKRGKTLEEAYYTQFGAPYHPGGQYRVAGPGFYQRNNRNSSYLDRRQTMEESLTKFMTNHQRDTGELNNSKRFELLTVSSHHNQRASIKTLEIQIGQMIKVLQERGFRIYTQYQNVTVRIALSEQVPFHRRLHDYYCVEWKQAHMENCSNYNTLPQKKGPREFYSTMFVHNVCFDKALVDLGASVSVMPFSTYTNLGLGDLAPTRLTIELADRTPKHPRGNARNVLVKIRKFIFPIDFIILDIPEDDDVPLILGRLFLSTTHAKIDVFKRKITLRVGEEKIVFKSIKPATSIIRRVYMLKVGANLDFKIELIGEAVNESFDPNYGNYIELNDLDVPLEPRMNFYVSEYSIEGSISDAEESKNPAIKAEIKFPVLTRF